MHERITIDPQVCHGQACVRGTRIPVHQIVRMLANGDTIEGLSQDYPSLKREDILACLDYAASLAEEQVTPIEVVANVGWKFLWMKTSR
jgi:uncharacterized protein (DUF433 family)